MHNSLTSSVGAESRASPVPKAELRGVILGRWKACAVCRVKKMRCDGAQPTCSPCAQFGRDCRYMIKKKAPASKESAVFAAVVAGLQNKVDRLIESSNLAAKKSKARERDLIPDVQSSGAFDAASSKVPSGSIPHTVTELSDADRDKILAMFFRYQHRSGSQIQPERFFRSLRGGRQDCEPLPALVDTMLLIGLDFAHLSSQPHLLPINTPDSSSLLFRVHRGLERSLEHADRILDYLQASTLLCCWYFDHGRLQEGQYLSASTFRLAIDCGLHQIDRETLAAWLDGSDSRHSNSGTVLGEPRGPYEIFLRILTFWQCYWCDKVYALITGLPSSCDDATASCITTVWPRPPEEYETDIVLSQMYIVSLRELLCGATGDLMNPVHLDPRPADISHTYQCKALALLEWATNMCTLCCGVEDVSKADNIIDSLKTLHLALKVFEASLPAVDAPLLPHQPLLHPDVLHEMTSFSTIFTWLGVYVAQMQTSRAAECITKLKLCSTQEGAMITPCFDLLDLFGILGREPGDSSANLHRSFRALRYSIATSAIGLAYEVISQGIRMSRGGNAWLSEFPNVCGFIMSTPARAVVEETHILNAQLKTAIIGSDGYQRLSLSLFEAEEILEKALYVMTFLSANFPILKIQIQKIEQMR